MTLVYYRNGNGKITGYHLPPRDLSPEQLETAIAEFNKKGEKKAYLQEIEEDSLEMHLYERAQYQKRYPKEVIRAALDAIDEAKDAIYCLEQEG